ncbi:MAG: putative rRNA maturation factor [Cognaticolwellia sp.]
MNIIIDNVINFHNEQITFEHKQPIIIKKWLQSVAKQEGGSISSLSFIFCSDDYLHQINVEYLNHDTLTDVITFQYSESESDPIEGDIFISIDRIQENANQFETTFDKELHRVMIHGTLHLLGYGDKSSEAKTLMTEKENFYLQQL